MTARVAIVGSGLGGFVAYATLRHGGLEPDEIAVFGDDPDPAGAWRPRAAAIRQRLMRSESDGHCCPTSFPGLAAREAARRRDLGAARAQRLRPLPADRRRSSSATSTSCASAAAGTRASCRARIERVARRRRRLRARRPRRLPPRAARAGPSRASPFPAELAGDPRVVHAYEPHEYAARVAIVGAGMAAATEWLNALAAGAEVVSVRRREPARRPLNVARPLFTQARPRRLPRHAARPSAPRSCAASASRRTRRAAPGTSRSSAAEREGRFRVAPDASNGAEQVICATGFRRGFAHDPLLARLVDEHGLETEDRWIVLADDSTVPALTDATRTLALAGVPGAVGLPGGRHARRDEGRARGVSAAGCESCPTR